LLLLNEQRSTHFRLYIAYFLLTSNIRLAVTVRSSSEGRNSLLYTTMNHTDCVLSFSQADKAVRPVTSCGSSVARFSAAVFLSRARAPSIPTLATSHQVRRSLYVRTSLRTQLPTLHHRFRSKYYNTHQEILPIHADYTSGFIVVTVSLIIGPNETKYGVSKMVVQTSGVSSPHENRQRVHINISHRYKNTITIRKIKIFRRGEKPSFNLISLNCEEATAITFAKFGYKEFIMFLKQAFSDFIKIRHLRAPGLLKRMIFSVVSLFLRHCLCF
jgi:hypothetical protein